MVRLGNSVLALDADATSVADAVRIRDALDPLLIEDALRHASPAHVDQMRDQVVQMEQAVTDGDPTAFIRANWELHATIASVSPSAILRSVYTSLLALIETHTLSVQRVSEQALPDFIAERLQLHRDLVEAIAVSDRATAQRLIQEHNTTA